MVAGGGVLSLVASLYCLGSIAQFHSSVCCQAPYHYLPVNAASPGWTCLLISLLFSVLSTLSMKAPPVLLSQSCVLALQQDFMQKLVFVYY